MTEEAQGPAEETIFPKTVGERLRDARLAQKLELSDVAQRTRIPQRHLQAIEDGDFKSIPTTTYAVGFARSYARAVGVDEVEVAREVRGRSDAASVERKPTYQPYDIEEAQRTPSRGVMIGAGLLGLLVLVAALVWIGSNWLGGGDTPDAQPSVAAATDAPTAAPSPAPTPAAADGPVALVATDEVWVRVYDGDNNTLKMGTMKAGQRFDVPATAKNPMINVGRPDKLQVLVGGAAVAPLGSGKVAIKDVPISASALAARNLPAPAATATATAPAGATPGAAPSPAQPTTPDRAVPPFFQDGPGGNAQ